MAGKVYVVAHDGGCEGHSEPLAAFATRALADIFVAGADAGYRHGVKVFELPLNDGLALPTPLKEQ